MGWGLKEKIFTATTYISLESFTKSEVKNVKKIICSLTGSQTTAHHVWPLVATIETPFCCVGAQIITSLCKVAVYFHCKYFKFVKCQQFLYTLLN